MKLSNAVRFTPETAGLRRRPTGRYIARIVGTDFHRVGESKETALTCLLERLALLEEHQAYRRYWHAGGYTFCLYFTFDGWAYDMTRPEYDHPSACFMSTLNKLEAVASVERHVAQIVADACTPARIANEGAR